MKCVAGGVDEATRLIHKLPSKNGGIILVSHSIEGIYSCEDILENKPKIQKEEGLQTCYMYVCIECKTKQTNGGGINIIIQQLW